MGEYKTITTKTKQFNYLLHKGFSYNPVENAYTREYRKGAITLGIYIVRFFGDSCINAVFRTEAHVYLNMLTCEEIGNYLHELDYELDKIYLGK